MLVIRTTKNQPLQLSIIIVNYNVKYFLEQCLCSVVKACSNMEAEILVIDNNSTDGSRDFFANRFPKVQFIWQQENAGFAKANNEALKLAKGKRILFLNPDTILPEDGLEKCLQFFDQQNNIGALGVRMIDGSGNFLPESKRGFPSALASFCKMTGLNRLFPQSKIAARYYLGHLPEDKANVVDVLSGAFMMVDKKVLDAVGSFDEAYFMYAEDIDLSYRIQKAGYKIFYFAGTTIIHFKGESTAKQSASYIRNFYGTMILFVKKHYSGLSKHLYVLLLNILIAVKSIFASNKKTASTESLTGSAFVIADEVNFKKLKTALEKNFNPVERNGAMTKQPVAGTVVFCESSLHYKEMISTMQLYKNNYGFFIHATNSSSLVGSSDKNHPGTVITL